MILSVIIERKFLDAGNGQILDADDTVGTCRPDSHLISVASLSETPIMTKQNHYKIRFI